MTRRSPFKFLDAYNEDDKDHFFGRSEEIEALYNMAYQSNLTLVYGSSGTGKTSLIQCGLATRFKPTDWLDIYIRRRDDINTSLLESLKRISSLRERDEDGSLKQRLKKRHAERSGKPAPSDTEVTEEYGEVVRTLKKLDRVYFKPIYLIFDQFEELFILGNKEEEQPEFYSTVAEILEYCPFCRLIFILREEAIAELYDFEKVVPNLFDKRLRVERFNRETVREVIVSMAEKFDISLESENVPYAIIDAITSGKGQTELTYLQVFLDALWQEAVEVNGSEDNVTFTHDLVRRVGDIEDVLSNFLENQSGRIQSELESKFNVRDDRAMRDILSRFVTLEGTKQPRSREELEFRKLSSEQVDYVLRELDSSRIIRYDDDRYELMHDALAAKIAEDRTTADVAFLEVLKLIRDGYRNFKRTGDYLSANALVLYDTYQERIELDGGLTAEQKQFVQQSIVENERRKKRRTRIVATIGSVLLVGVISMTYLWTEVRSQGYDAAMNAALNHREQGDYESALTAYSGARGFVRNEESIDQEVETTTKLQTDKQIFEELMSQADSLRILDTLEAYVVATNKLIKARDVYRDIDTRDLMVNDADSIRLANDRSTLDIELDAIYRELMRKATIMYRVGSATGYRQALGLYRISGEIDPGSEAVAMADSCRIKLGLE